MTFAEFKNSFNLPVNFVTYYGLLEAIPNKWKRTLETGEKIERACTCNLEKVLTQDKVCKYIYSKTIQSICSTPSKTIRKWSRVINQEIEETTFGEFFNHLYKITKSTKLQNFQYKLLHNIIPTNTFLCTIHIKDTDKCTFCKECPETVCHLFFCCTKVANFWKEVKDWIFNKTGIRIHLVKQDILLGKPTGVIITELLILISKYYIYTSRVKEAPLKIEHYINKVKEIYHIEYEIAKTSQRVFQFRQRWAVMEHNGMN